MSLFSQIYVGINLIILIILMIINFEPLWVLLLFNILTFLPSGNINDFLIGFSNSGILVLLFISPIIIPIVQSHQVNDCFHYLLSLGSKHHIVTLAKTTIPAFLISFWLPNTPIVIALVPFLDRWCQSQNLAVSKYLIPLSYATILGGVNTLIGTSTNLLSYGIVQKWNIQWNFFSMTPITLIPSIISLIVLIVLSDKLLPNNINNIIEPKESLFKCKITIPPKSCLIGKPLANWINGHVYHYELCNNIDQISVNQQILKADDQLIIYSPPNEIIKFLEEFKNSIQTHSLEHFDIKGLQNMLSKLTNQQIIYDKGIKPQFYKVVLSRTSPIVGCLLESNKFESLYHGSIIGISDLATKYITLVNDLENAQSNQTSIITDQSSLLIYATCHFLAKYANNPEFVSISRYRGVGLLNNNYDQPMLKFLKQWHIALILFVISIGISISEIIGLLPLVVIDILILAALNILDADTIINSCNWSVYLLLVLSTNIGQVIIKSQLDLRLANLISNLDQMPIFVIVLFIGFITILLTAFTSNAACVSILLPIVYRISQTMNISSSPLLLYVTALASIDFITPYGYQTNLIVQPIGKYKCIDYFKLGTILTIIYYIGLTIAVYITIPPHIIIISNTPTNSTNMLAPN